VVTDHAGAFFVFTSNVDAHHYDWFRACEIRECHGNTELYQCGRVDNACGGVWRAPRRYRFEVDKETMLAPPMAAGGKVLPEAASPVEPSAAAAASEGEPPSAAAEATGNPPAAAGLAEAAAAPAPAAAPRVGRVRGRERTTTLRYMPDPAPDVPDAGFDRNHPTCVLCSAPARPAILMFGDMLWQDLESQAKRQEDWTEAVVTEMRERRERGESPVRAVILEIGAGGNVTTVRRSSEHYLDEFLGAGAEATLIRVNPDFPLGDGEAYAPGCEHESRVLSLMAGGLDTVHQIDAAMGFVQAAP